MDLSEALTYFNNTFVNLFNRHAPLVSKRIKGKRTPWVQKNNRKIMDFKRDLMLRKARKSRNAEHWRESKRLRNKCTNKLRSAKRKYHKDLLTENQHNLKSFWNAIKQIFPTKSFQSVSVNRAESKQKSYQVC